MAGTAALVGDANNDGLDDIVIVIATTAVGSPCSPSALLGDAGRGTDGNRDHWTD